MPPCRNMAENEGKVAVAATRYSRGNRPLVIPCRNSRQQSMGCGHGECRQQASGAMGSNGAGNEGQLAIAATRCYMCSSPLESTMEECGLWSEGEQAAGLSSNGQQNKRQPYKLACVEYKQT